MIRNERYGIRLAMVAMIVGVVLSGTSVYGQTQDSGTVISLEDGSRHYWISFSPDGDNIVTSGNDGRIRIWDAKTGEVVKVFDSVATIGYGSVEYSPDGTQIVATGNYEVVDEETGEQVALVQVFDAATGAEIHRLKRHPYGTARAYYSKDGKKIYSSGFFSDQYLCVWDAETGALLNAWKIDKFQNKFTVSPDERFIALARSLSGKASAIRIIDAATGDSLTEFLFDTLAPTSFPWLSDSRHLAISLAPHSLYLDKMPIQLVDVETHEVVRTFAGHAQGVGEMSISPDGNYLASCGNDNVVRVWDINTGQELDTLSSAGDIVRFSPDGGSISVLGYGVSLIWTLPKSSSVPVTGDLVNDMNVTCRPNPATSSTDVLFRLDKANTVHLSMLDAQGRVVVAGIDEAMAAGDHLVPVGVSGVPSGAYFWVVRVAEKTMVRSLRVVR